MGEQPSSLRATSPSMAFLWGKSMLEPGTAWPSPDGAGRVQYQDGVGGSQGLTLHHPTLLVTSPSQTATPAAEGVCTTALNHQTN